mgnify:CR=1 FL=1
MLNTLGFSSIQPSLGGNISKISKSLGIVSRLRHFVPTDALLSIYQSFIQPYITYGIVVRGQAAQTNLDKLLILQKRALRLIHFAPYRSHAIPLFNHYNILPLNFQYCKSVCTIMHDVSNNSLQPNISNLFSTYDVDFESNPGHIGGSDNSDNCANIACKV